MSRPYYMTSKMRDNIVKKLEKQIHEAMLYDKTITVKPEYVEVPASVELSFDPIAFLKMYTLVQNVPIEVAWHGLVHKITPNHFHISDILVYPQEATSVTVECDEVPYTKWFMNLDKDVANHLHLHGHSHVYMNTTPSSEDIKSQLKYIEMLGSQGFYIFMIMNKRNDIFFKIVDLDEDQIYDSRDVFITIRGETFNSDEWSNEVMHLTANKGKENEDESGQVV